MAKLGRNQLLFYFLLVLIGVLVVTSIAFSRWSASAPPWLSLGESPSSVYVVGQLRPADDSSFAGHFAIDFSSFGFNVNNSPKVGVDATKACLDHLELHGIASYLGAGGFRVDSGKTLISLGGIQGICYTIENSQFVSGLVTFNAPLTFYLAAPYVQAVAFKYPYDEILINLSLVARGAIFNQANQPLQDINLPAEMRVDVSVPGWVPYQYNQTTSVGTEEYKSGVILKRPLPIRIFTPTIVALLLVMTAMIPLSDSESTAIQVAIALILGTIGIRQAILPIGFSWLTAIDAILLGQQAIVILGVVGYIGGRRLHTHRRGAAR